MSLIFIILNSVSLFVIIIFAIFLIKKYKTSILARSLFWIFSALSLWLAFEFIGAFYINPKISFLSWRLAFPAIYILTILLLNFVLILNNKKLPKLFYILLFLGEFIVIILVIFSNQIIEPSTSESYNWGKQYTPGRLFWIHSIMVTIPLLTTLILAIQKYYQSNIEKEKKQMRYITIGIAIPIIVGIITNLILPLFSIAFPEMVGISSVITVILFSYSIYRWETFSITLESLTIKNKISIPVLLAVFILSFGTGYVFYYFSAKSLKQETSQFLESFSDSKKEQIYSYMKNREIDILSLAKSPIVQGLFNEDLSENVRQVKDSVKNEATKVSDQVSVYLKNNPQKTLKDLQNDPDFQSIAVQPIGKTGYTALTDYNSLTARFHKNAETIDLDLHVLAEKLPGFWSIMAKTEGGQNADGFYDWLEPDGHVEKKYMYIDIIDEKTADKVGLSVAATTYINEFGYDLSDFKIVSDYLSYFQNFHDYLDLTLINTEGYVLFSTQNKIEVGKNINNPSFQNTNLNFAFQDVLEGKQLSFYDKAVSEKNPAYLMSPVYDLNSKNILGVIVLEIDFRKLDEILLDISSSQTQKISFKNYLIGENLLIRSSSEREKGLDASTVFATENAKNCFKHAYLSPEKIKENHKEISEFLDVYQEKTIGAHFYIPEYNWCLLSEINEKDAIKAVEDLLKIFILSGLIYILILYLIINWISRQISNPIKKLQKGIGLIEAGDISHKVGTDTNDEIGELSRAFDKMTIAIKKSQADIDQKVKEQTSEIIEKQKLLRDQQKAVLNVLEDVAEEKNNVGEEKDKIDAILHSIGDGVFAIDIDMKITMFNEIAENISGYSQKDVIGKDYKKILKFVNEKDGKINDDYIKKVIKTNEPQKMPRNINLIKKNGEQVPVADIASPLRDKDEQVRGAVVVFRDVEKERAVDKAKTEFVSLASHQLRTPLTSINWYTEMMISGDVGKVNPNQKSYLEEIYKGNQRMVALVNSLLNVSRLELGTFAVEPKIINIKNLAEQEIKTLLPTTQKKKITITTSYDKGIDKYSADPKLLAMIFQNLLSNAVKYNNEGGKVDIKVQKRAHDIYITIADNGYGIPKKQHKNIFTKLFRADNVRQMDTEGTGLGVYIIKEIIDQAGGTIKFDSEEGKGTTFYVSLPLEGMKKKKGAKSLD